MPIWTHSRLETAEACPLNYCWSYLERRSGYSIASGAGRIGNTVHSALETLIKNPGDNVEVVLLRAIMAHNLTTQEELEALTFRSKVEAFTQRFHAWRQKHSVEEDQYWVERKLAMDAEFEACSYTDRDKAFFRGVIDLAAMVTKKDGGKILFLWDHKTGEPTDIKEKAKQFHGYSILGLATYPDVDEVRCAIHYVKTGQIIFFPQKFSPETIRAELQNGLMDRIKNAEEIASLNDPPAVESWKCTFCQYAPVCPLKGGAAP